MTQPRCLLTPQFCSSLKIFRSFRQHMAAAMGALKLLADSFAPDKLNEVGRIHCQLDWILRDHRHNPADLAR